MKTPIYFILVLLTLIFGCGKKIEESSMTADTTYTEILPPEADTTATDSVAFFDREETAPPVETTPERIETPTTTPEVVKAPIEEGVEKQQAQIAEETAQQQQAQTVEVIQSPVMPSTTIKKSRAHVEVLEKKTYYRKSPATDVSLQTGTPRKISYYEQSATPAYERQAIPIVVELQDAGNKFIKGQKDYVITIRVQGIDTKYTQTDSLRIPAGEGTGEYALTLARAGIYKIICTHNEMQPAEWFLKVLPLTKKINYTPENPSNVFRFVQADHAVLTGFVQTIKKVRADGIDPATITFFLQDPHDIIPDGDSVKVSLSSNLSFLINERDSKSVSLTSKTAGTVKIRAQCVNPNVSVQEPEYEVKFYPAIDSFVVMATPPEIDLLQDSYIALQLLDKAGRTIATDEDIEATLFVESESGTGILDSELLKILTGKFEGRVLFLPTGTGKIKVRGFVKTLPAQAPAILKIVWPVKVTLLTILGGLIGAFISHLVARKKKLIVTLAIGAVTGFVFFWIVLSIGMANLSHAIVLNQLSVVVFGIAGGWLGADTMKFLLKRLGVEL